VHLAWRVSRHSRPAKPSSADMDPTSSEATGKEAERLYDAFGGASPAQESAAQQPQIDHSASDEQFMARANMVREAELRAEHQQQARAMMIDLARAVSDLNNQNKELNQSLRSEVQHSNDLEAKVARLQKEIVQMKEEAEEQASQRLVERGMRTNGMVWSMLLEASRDVYQPELFPRPRPQKAKKEDDASPSSPSSPQAGGKKRLQPRLLVPSHLDKLKPQQAFKHIASGTAGLADRLTFVWMLRMWRQEVTRAVKQRVVDEVEEQRKSEVEDRERIIGDEVEKRVGEFRKAVADLEYQVEMLSEDKKSQEKRVQELLAQLDQQILQSREREQQHQDEVRQCQGEIKALKLQIEDANRKRSSMNSHYEETERELRRELAIREAEIKRLREIISNLECDLQQALVLARHLKDTAMKAKRDAAMSVSPKKFALLIADLEEMKDRLTRLGKDYNKEKTSGEALKAELERRQRQLELERQFLPFLHVSRGPLGQKAPSPAATATAAGKKGKATDAGWEVPPSPGPGVSSPLGDSTKLRASQSTGALPLKAAA